MAKILWFVFLFFFFYPCSAQKIYGIVLDEKGDQLPYSSITVKGTSIGSSANNRAKFSIAISPGSYTIVCQHVGYAAQEKKIDIGKDDMEVLFVLKQQKLNLKEVIVKSGAEDPAYAIIRAAIKMRPQYYKEVEAFTCCLYTKDMIKLRRLPKKILGRKIPEEDRMDMGLDTMGAGIIYLSESVARIASQQPDKFKMEVKSSRVSGSDGFGFTFPAFISLYKNNVTVFTQKFNPRGFVSPLADRALGFYKYQYLGSFWEDGREINSIRVTPRRGYEPLFSGILNIAENTWRIHSADLLLTKKSQLEILDSLHITQIHVPVNADVWRVKNQLLHFSFSQLGIDAAGNFLSVYSDYNIHPVFNKKFFNNVFIRYDTGVNKKPASYWDTTRPVPLEKEEIKDYLVKDSLFEVKKDAALSKSAMDSLNKKQGKIKPLDILWNGVHKTRYSTANTFSWGIDPLIKSLEYNPAEGVVVNVGGEYRRELEKSSTWILIQPHLRYGFSNRHFNGWLDVHLRTRDMEADGKLKRQSWDFSGGRRVTQFNRESPITPLINSISTLFYGDNFMKTYENVFGKIGFSKRFESGLRVGINALYEDRKPLNNTTSFTLFKKDSIHITPNYPFDKVTDQVVAHKALLFSVDMSFRPGQKYIQFPAGKVSLGSKYPLFTINYTKGIQGVFGSDVNFDKWKFTISDGVNLRMGGLMKYKIGTGGFFNTKNVYLQDFQHFNGNLTAAASEYVNSFQLVSYYAFSTQTNFYALGHIEHHFNGLLTNKIPLFNKLNWHMVAGSNAFYVNSNNNHVELFAGIENILKIFRVDFVSGYNNGKYNGSAVRIGLGGLLGGNMVSNGGGGNVDIVF